MDPIEEIKGLYFKASKETIAQDFARAIDLLKSLPDEATRERAAVYMEGLAEMRHEFERPRGGGSPNASRKSFKSKAKKGPTSPPAPLAKKKSQP